MTLNEVYNKQQDTAQQLYTSFDSRFDAVFANIISLATARLSGLNANDVLEYELVWQEILSEAGYYELVSEYVDISFDDVYDNTLKAFSTVGLATAFTESDLTKINILKSMHKEFFLKIGDDIGLTVKKHLYNYAISDASVSQMALNISKDIKDTGLAKYSKTYARTAITNYQQEVINVRSADEDGVWVYVGVSDGKTRPFCSKLLRANKYYTTAEKNKYERDEDREFNCRHRFYLVSKDWAEDENYEKA